ncbi:MAG: DMT family transporter [Verrucomicrobia bacterium]|nr:DMT family transporter [Verrucomicrobiota bacterium]
MQPWFLWAMVAVLCWGGWAVMGKAVGEAFSPAQSQAYSTLGMLPVLLILLRRAKPAERAASKKHAGWAFGAGLMACLGNMAYYDALSRGGKAATVMPLTAMYPLVTILLALVFLKERFNRIQFLGIGCSLVSIYLFNVPQDGSTLQGGLLFALAPIVFWGLAGLMQKLTTGGLSGEAGAFWFLAAFVPVAILLAASQPWPRAVAGSSWTWVVLLGLTFALGNLALLIAFARGGKASILTPFTALYPVIGIPVAIFMFGEKIGGRESLGIALSLLAVVALSHEPEPQSSPPP